LIYFSIVRCGDAGVGISEVESHLDRRTYKLQRRPGNAKKERIDAASKILSESGTKPRAAGASPVLTLLLPAFALYVTAALVTRSRR